MGWWTQDEEGRSFATAATEDMVWGDGPADIMGNAVDSIVEEFEREWKRKPTKNEIRAGLGFTLGGWDE